MKTLDFLRKYRTSAYLEKFARVGARSFIGYRWFRLRNDLAEWWPFPGIIRARLRTRRYAHIISIGVNCEAAFRFFRKWKFVDSALFSWANVRDLATLTQTLRNLETLMSGDVRFSQTTHMWICKNTNVAFHGKLKFSPETIPTPEELADDLNDLRGRIRHLKAKFLDFLRDDGETILVHRLDREDAAAPDLDERLTGLEDALRGLGMRNTRLLIVCERGKIGKLPERPGRLFRFVRLYNPLNAAADRKVGDAVGWQAIYTEFAPLHILPQRHKFKFE